MTIDADRAKYFWLAAHDPVTATEPEPSTFDGSLVTPCIDLYEYVQKLVAAMALVGNDPDPAKNQGDFIYIANWWLGLLGGDIERGIRFIPPGSGLGSAGPKVDGIDAFDLDPEGPELRLSELLKLKARNGVEVRVLGWVSYALLCTSMTPFPIVSKLLDPMLANSVQAKDPGGLVSINSQTMDAAQDLRSEPRLAKNVILNVVGHSAGAVHLKMSMVGTKPDAAGKSKMVGFTGGLDFVENRWAPYMHRRPSPDTWDRSTPPTLYWHDVEAAVEGKAAQAVYDHFRAAWNENLRRRALRFNFEGKRMMSYVAGTEAIPARVVDQPLLSPMPALVHHVQSVRTVPAFNYLWYNCWPEGESASFAPQGLFEIRAAWRKAILAAETCIYIEDQVYWSREVFEWINESIRNRPALKFVGVMSGQADPNDAPADDSQILHNSINEGLLGIGTPRELTAAQRDQIRLYRIRGETFTSEDTFTIVSVTAAGGGQVTATTDIGMPADGNSLPADIFANKDLFVVPAATPGGWKVLGNPECVAGGVVSIRLEVTGAPPVAGDEYRMLKTHGLLAHSKITVVDDKWGLIGSANVNRRSLYTDWEHAVAFMDPNGVAVRDFRARLWAEHFKSATTAPFNDLAVALGGWEPSWNPAGGSPVPAPGAIVRVLLPLPIRPMGAKIRELLDIAKDPDSRQDWGGVCKPDLEQ
jgi:phosphatidylserine/phosphatidylglycerophosphate/cardiolipin synthase-like enzyme